MTFLLSLGKVTIIAGMVTALLGLLGPVLRRHYHAKWRYWVWLCLAILLLSPLAAPLLPQSSGDMPAAASRAPVQLEIPAMAVTYDREVGLSLAPQTTLDGTASAERDTPVQPDGRPESPSVTVPERAETEIHTEAAALSTPKAIPAETVLLILWAVGAIVCLLWVVTTTAVFSRRCMRWAKQPDGETAAVLAAEQEAMGFAKPVALYLTSATSSPAAMGLFRRKIVFAVIMHQPAPPRKKELGQRDPKAAFFPGGPG